MKRASVVVDLFFGDSGKGTITDYLVRRHGSTLVVRYGGGPQCAHNVVTSDGKHHCFSQFGSGTLAGTDTFLGENMLIDPFAIVNEATVLETIGITNPLSKLHIDWDCPVITPWQRLANQIREAARTKRHGSVGLGIGETRSDFYSGIYITPKDVVNAPDFYERLIKVRHCKLEQMREYRKSAPELYVAMLDLTADQMYASYKNVMAKLQFTTWNSIQKRHEDVVFEGHQGLLLDQSLGFFPYVTFSDCTPCDADYMCAWEGAEVERVGVMRSYLTRHGAGPLPTETSASVLGVKEPHNTTHPFMGEFRVGYLDMPLLRYSLRCLYRANPLDFIAITHLDQLSVSPVGAGYLHGGTSSTKSLEHAEPVLSQPVPIKEAVEEVSDLPVLITSHGPTEKNKRTHNKKATPRRTIACLA